MCNVEGTVLGNSFTRNETEIKLPTEPPYSYGKMLFTTF